MRDQPHSAIIKDIEPFEDVFDWVNYGLKKKDIIKLRNIDPIINKCIILYENKHYTWDEITLLLIWNLFHLKEIYKTDYIKAKESQSISNQDPITICPNCGFDCKLNDIYCLKPIKAW